MSTIPPPPSSEEMARAKSLRESFAKIKQQVSQVIVGQDATIEQLLIAMLAGGHCLLEGVPGLAKTLMVRSLAQAMDLDFHRIQFTPDLMPADITGTDIIQQSESGSRQLSFVKGPVFTQILLADEINRTPPKTQAALLEAMQEKTVTVSGLEYRLPKPFFVLATQNPIEQEGTYPLPEAQLDRFMFNMILDYPTFEEEINIVKATTSSQSINVNKIVSQEEIIGFQNLVRKVPVSDNVYEYAVKLVAKTRAGRSLASPLVNDYIEYGAGPRASQHLIIGAKANALINGKYSPDIEDVQAVAKQVLRHRMVRNYKAEAEGVSADHIIESIY